jgi:hypothetical protein
MCSAHDRFNEIATTNAYIGAGTNGSEPYGMSG